MSELSIIEFRNVSKDYYLRTVSRAGIKSAMLNWRQNRTQRQKRQTVHGLREVSLSVQRGETFGVIGHNGSGKSTALGLIAGVLRPTSGEVLVRGRVSPLLELGAGFHPELSGRDNILLNGVLLGLRRRRVLQRLDEIIEFSGIGEFVDHPLRTYSSGMMARLGFSVAVHLDPDILLIDEVIAVGDASFKEKCEKTIAGFQQSATTIVLVSHDLDSVARLCSRVAVFEQGAVVGCGPTQAMLAQYGESVRQSGRGQRERSDPSSPVGGVIGREQ